MSLIIDALKKAQQLRIKENQVIPSFDPPISSKKKLRKKRFGLIGIAFICLFIFSFILKETIPLSSKDGAKDTSPVLELNSKEERGKPIDYDSYPEGILTQNEGELEESPLQTDSQKIRTEAQPNWGKKVETSIPIKVKEEKEISSLTASISDLFGKRKESSSASLSKDTEPPVSLEIKKEKGSREVTDSEIVSLFNSGVVFHHQREFSRAIETYQKVIDLNPAYIEAYNNLGIIHQEMGNFDGALKFYQKAIEIEPRYEKGWNNLGILWILKGDLQKAKDCFQKILSINPNHLESYLHLGTIWKKEGQWQKAIESYQFALSLDPYRGETHYHLGLLYEEMGRMDLALPHYETFVHLSGPSYPELILKVQRRISLWRSKKE
ncbi:MAG: tetratricopeptide repeat protein [Thermodesulfobacteriota bacterium]